MGWVIFWIVITLIAIFIAIGSFSLSVGFASWCVMALIGGMIGLLTTVCKPCSDKTDPARQATVEAENANVQAQETAEAQEQATPEATPTPYPYGTEVALTTGTDCFEKLIVKASVETEDGYYYKVEPACAENRKFYSAVYEKAKDFALWKEGSYTGLCECGGNFSGGNF